MNEELNIQMTLIIEEGYNDSENIEDIKKQIKEHIENISGVYFEDINFE